MLFCEQKDNFRFCLSFSKLGYTLGGISLVTAYTEVSMCAFSSMLSRITVFYVTVIQLHQ